MPHGPDATLPSRDQLIAIIHTQTEIARQGLDLAQVMGVVVERTLELIEADGAAIELSDGEHMVYRAVSGIAAGQLGLRLGLGSSLSGLCVRTGEVQRCLDTELDPRVDQASCRSLNIRSMLIIPLQHAGCVVGVLKVMFRNVAGFKPSDEAVLGLLAEVLGASMFFAQQFAADDLYYRATHDQMTGLANRALFFDRVRSELARVKREGSAFGLLMLDMDGLKAINDGLGHRAGDAALCEVGQRLQQALRQSDLLARLGGDEFGILLLSADGLHGLQEGCERLHAAVAQPFQFEEQWLSLGISIGAVRAPEAGVSLEDLLEQADRAMYQNKRVRKGGGGPR